MPRSVRRERRHGVGRRNSLPGLTTVIEIDVTLVTAYTDKDGARESRPRSGELSAAGPATSSSPGRGVPCEASHRVSAELIRVRLGGAQRSSVLRPQRSLRDGRTRGWRRRSG